MSVRFIILDIESGHFHVRVDTEECPVSQLRETGLSEGGGSSAEGFAWETRTARFLGGVSPWAAAKFSWRR
jgi:hypothetical protein